MARDIIRGDVGLTERLIEYDTDEARYAKIIAVIPINADEAEIMTVSSPAFMQDLDGLTLLGEILRELKAMNHHLAVLTGEHFTEG